MRIRLFNLTLVLFFSLFMVKAQDIPQHISYFRVYELMDELANMGLVDLNSAVKPYSRSFIANELQKVSDKIESGDFLPALSRRIKREIEFFLLEMALENKGLPNSKLRLFKSDKSIAAFWPPAISYRDDYFRARITPILGMHLTMNQNGVVDKRWFGAEFQGYFGKNLAVYGSIRDISHTGDGPLSQPTYLNNEPGYEYTLGTDFSDSRGGITWSNEYLSIGIKKDNIVWGDNYHSSNILSGRAPSFPMIHLQLKPTKWFELNYFHGWLVSNVLDTTNYYMDNVGKLHHRPVNKYMAANFFTFTPIKNLKLSIGNSIVYAENNVHPSYFIPIAFYKSMDHVQTKGLGAENQNSQLFMNISSRIIQNIHLYSSIFIDEFQLRRMSPDSPDKNPISIKMGAHMSNIGINNLSLTAEYTNTNIINYKHSIPALSYASNSYNMGHYLGDNTREFYAGMKYKPIRGLDLEMYYIDALKGNDYEYIRHGFHNNTRASIITIISNPTPGDVIWTNKTLGFRAMYELFQNGYAVVKLENSNIQSYEAELPIAFAENRMTAQEVLDKFTPKMLHGKNTTLTIGFSFGF